jgi:hypothetical protein
MDNINIPKISYKIDGRFGNNLFQYLATKILQLKLKNENRNYEYEYDYDYHLKFNENINDIFIVNDENFLNIIENVHIIPLNSSIYLDGYFQFEKHILENKIYVSSIINEKNDEKINDKYTVSDLSRKLNSFNQFSSIFNENLLVVHLRLDDFIGDKVCMHYINYYNIISMIPDTIKKVKIIVDKCKQNWELEYLKIIYSIYINANLEVKIESGGELLDDFCKLYYSKNLLSSNSTFCYLAGLLGNHKLSWCPSNCKKYPHQKIEKFNNDTITIDTIYL